MKYFLNEGLSIWRKNALEFGFLCLLVFSVLTLFQVEFVRIARTFGVTKQVTRLDALSSTAQPLNLGSIPNGNRAYIQLDLEFHNDGSTGYPNLFQTDVVNSGIRAELHGSTIALLYPSPAEKEKTKALVLSDKLRVGRWYSFHLEALNGAFIKSGISESRSSYSESDNPEFGTGSFKVGIGFDDIRRFHGEIRNAVITRAVAREPWVGMFILYTIQIFLIALIVICLYFGYKDFNFTQPRLYRIALFHFLCQIAGISYLVKKDDVALRQFFDLGAPIYAVIPWDMPPLPPMANSFTAYALLLTIAASFVFASFAGNGWGRRLVSPSRALSGGLVAYEVICMALPLVTDSLEGLWLWFAVASLLPAYVIYNRRHLRGPMVERTALAVCLVLLGMVVGNLLLTSWNPNLRFLNDYADLPEYTILKNGQQVENRRFLRGHSIQGEYSYDPCAEEVNGSCKHLPRSIFANERVPFNIFPPGGGVIYDWDKEILKAYRPLATDDVKIIRSLWGVTSTSGIGTQNKTNTSNLSSEVDAFLFKNRMELGAQASLGRFFYHHAFLYLPALEVALSSPTSVTPAQYGKGLTQTLGILLKIGGAINFQTYYKIYWVAIVAYLILLGAIAGWISKNRWIGIAASATGIVCLLSVAPDALRMAPGFNPMRHLPDLFCFLIIAIDSRRNSYGSALLRAISIAFFLWWNKEFGIFLLFGSIAWHIFNIASDHHRWRASLGRVAIECILAALILVFSGGGENNGLTFYNLMGIGTPPTRWHDIIFWMAIWVPAIGVVAWGRFFWYSKSPEETASTRTLLDVSGVGLIYSGFTTVYALWNPSPNHYAVVALTAVLPFAMIFTWAHLVLSVRDEKFSWLPKFVAAVATIMVLPFAYHDKLLFQDYDQVFKEHRIFKWRFPGIVGMTTADPKLLEESAELVHKYQPEGRILFVSRYDTLMKIMLNRSGALPYVDIPSSVVSWSMIDRVAAKINESKPTYIFVDRDLQVDREWAVTDRSPDMSVVSPSRYRVGSLAALAQVFRIVAPCYVPGEVRGVLQVWYRTCK